MHYDLIIVGGGLVGKSLAAALIKAPLKLALIDASEVTRPDPRLIALNYGSACFLKSLGLWAALEPYSASIQEVHVSHRGRFGVTRLEAKTLPLPALGYVLGAQQINQTLDQALLRMPQGGHYTELRPARVKALALQEQHNTLTVETQGHVRMLSGNLIIAADGTASTLRSLLNFDTQTIDYQQSALVTTTTLGRSHYHRAYERFLDDGALAMLPLKSQPSSPPAVATIWTAGHETIQTLQNLDEVAFLQRLQAHFGYRLGALKSCSKRHAFPLQSVQVKRPLQDKVLLVGNAAHTLHPLAAQGLNLALYEIAHLSQALLQNQGKGLALHEGLAEKIPHFQPPVNRLFSHYLNHIFASDFWGSDFLRQLGLVSLDLCLPIKKQLSRLMAMERIQWLNT